MRSVAIRTATDEQIRPDRVLLVVLAQSPRLLG
jgi:hypothetical protein